MTRRFIKLASMTAFLACSGAAYADTYRVSVLIIENLNPLIDEAFSVPVTLEPEPEATLLTTSNPANEKELRLLGEGERGLNPQADAVANSRSFRLHSHLSWVTELPQNQTETFTIPSVTSIEHAVQLSGYITIRRARFLHVTPDLLLTEWKIPLPDLFENFDVNPLELASQPETYPAQPELLWNDTGNSNAVADGRQNGFDNQQLFSQQQAQRAQTQTNNPLSAKGLEPVTFYHLHKARRMRSNRLHYLDHPKLAMLVEIQQVEQIEELEESEVTKELEVEQPSATIPGNHSDGSPEQNPGNRPREISAGSPEINQANQAITDQQ